MEILKDLEKRTDALRRLPEDSNERLVAGAGILAEVFALAQALNGMAWELRGLLGLHARPDADP